VPSIFYIILFTKMPDNTYYIVTVGVAGIRRLTKTSVNGEVKNTIPIFPCARAYLG